MEWVVICFGSVELVQRVIVQRAVVQRAVVLVGLQCKLKVTHTSKPHLTKDVDASATASIAPFAATKLRFLTCTWYNPALPTSQQQPNRSKTRLSRK